MSEHLEHDLMVRRDPGDGLSRPASSGPEDLRVAKAARSVPPTESVSPIERHGYRAPRGSGLFGMGGTTAILVGIAFFALIAFEHRERAKPVAQVLTVALIPSRSAPKSQPRPTETPKTVQTPAPSPLALPVPIVRSPIAALPPQIPVAVTPQPPAPETKPQSTPTPPVPAAKTAPAQPEASKGPDRWEGRVLARLERFRRYPSEAQHARQQGTVYLRFRIDRGGHVLSASIERSSGNAALDAAVMDTLHRADPLPKVPAERPDQVELVVPIEFTIAR